MILDQSHGNSLCRSDCPPRLFDGCVRAVSVNVFDIQFFNVTSPLFRKNAEIAVGHFGLLAK